MSTNGSFVVGSRNRLFNLISLNEFTLQEIKKPDFDCLAEEALFFASGEELKNLKKIKPSELQEPNIEHKKTGIDVKTRFQFTPNQLLTILTERGFRGVEVYPIHIHSLPIKFIDKYASIHASISNSLQPFGKNNSELVPYSSSFMLHLKK